MVHKEIKELLVLLVPRELKVLLESQDLRDRLVLWELRVPKDLLALLVLQDLRE